MTICKCINVVVIIIDGIIRSEDAVIEIKCPYSAFETETFLEAVERKKVITEKIFEFERRK